MASGWWLPYYSTLYHTIPIPKSDQYRCAKWPVIAADYTTTATNWPRPYFTIRFQIQNTTQNYNILYNIVPHNAVPVECTIPYHNKLYQTVPCNGIPYHNSWPFHTKLNDQSKGSLSYLGPPDHTTRFSYRKERGQLFGTTPPRTPPDFALPTVLLGPPMFSPDPAQKTLDSSWL